MLCKTKTIRTEFFSADKKQKYTQPTLSQHTHRYPATPSPPQTPNFFSQTLSTRTLHTSNPFWNLSNLSINHVFSHSISTPYFLLPQTTHSVSQHMVRKYFFSKTHRSCLSFILKPKAYALFVTVGTTTLPNNSSPHPNLDSW